MSIFLISLTAVLVLTVLGCSVAYADSRREFPNTPVAVERPDKQEASTPAAPVKPDAPAVSPAAPVSDTITAEQAKELMDTEQNYIILDVRTQPEYDMGHIPGALLIPNEVIREQAQDKLTDKDQLILVYCRSGRRSKEAAQALVELGYTNVKEFGGINDWPYQTTR